MDELQIIQSKIYEVRDVKVMLDKDLAELYHVTERLDIPKWNFKMGRNSQTTLCLTFQSQGGNSSVPGWE